MVLYIHYIDICMYECVCVCKYIDMCAVYIIKHTFIFKLPIISIKSTFVRHSIADRIRLISDTTALAISNNSITIGLLLLIDNLKNKENLSYLILST